ncbi:hypothetical protein EV363DRAFT_1234483 [Boletus edulis]|nr:hypothetical protein EV363DRAFT_1375326 [Boletus edulis]KAF8120925.1 hypothetical protein EV363DRAFT_1234483 [Boletus edulis]
MYKRAQERFTHLLTSAGQTLPRPLVMFARLTLLSIAVVAMAGAIAVANGADAPWCPTDKHDVCCEENVEDTPKGYQGSNCTLIEDSYGDCPDELCCNYYDAKYHDAWSCGEPRSS